MEETLFFKITALPVELNRRLMLENLMNQDFVLNHDFYTGEETIASENPEKMRNLGASGMGIQVSESKIPEEIKGNFTCLSIAAFQNKNNYTDENEHKIDNMYGLFSGSKIRVLSTFTKMDVQETIRLKENIEDKISKIEVRHSYSMNAHQARQSSAVYNDSYYQSYEKRLLSMLLENINDVLLNKGLSYKVLFFIETLDGSEDIINYIKSNLIVLEQSNAAFRNVRDILNHARKSNSIPLSYENASQAIALSNRIRRLVKVNTNYGGAYGDIEIGNYIENGITLTKQKALIEGKSLNLGTLITGLPGTGKTNSAKSIIGQAFKSRPSAAIISPTGEWNEFAAKNHLEVIKMGSSRIKLNFFRCETKNVHKFYENLSMLIASGSNAGPYKNSIEHCLISAFSKVYSRTQNPEPDQVYEEIEEAIIEQHAKRTPSGVRYTKHGENIRAALESIRQILMREQFAYAESSSIASIIRKGAVFDLSEISNNLKPLIYALLLNQVYNLCDEFDIHGDNELRLILCLEESQLIFNSENESGATLDLKERIQNFRKNGVALILITHNVNDISPNIRRLCQNKLYFRQSSDVAKYAANDLIFNETDTDVVMAALKMLGQRECAVNTVSISNGEKSVLGSSFVKMSEYLPQAFKNEEPPCQEKRDPTTLKLIFQSVNKTTDRYEVHYLREKIECGVFEGQALLLENLLQGKRYKFTVLGEKRKENREFEIKGGEENILRL